MIALGLTSALRASPPTITSAPAVDITYDVTNPNDSQYAYRITATEGATSFDAAGLPPDAVVNTSTGWINGNRNTPGTYNVAVRAANGEGAANGTVRLAIHPAVTGVRSSQGVFHAGQNFTFTLHYNAAVTVTGTPALSVAIGPSGAATFKNAVYVSGSGTDELTFSYTVVAGDEDADGVQLSPSAPQGGTIREASGLDASPTLPVKYFVSGITITAQSGLASTPATTPSTGGRLANVSSRLRVTEGDATRSLITGFAVTGTAPKRVLLRAVGPTLSSFGVQGALADPRLRLYSSSGAVVADNDNWSGTDTSAAGSATGAFALAAGARDAATVVTLQPGVYTLVVMANGGDGVALAEVYDADAAGVVGASEITNLSTRGHVDGGEGTLIAGFTVKGDAPRRVLIRGVGPTLGGFGVTDALGNPTLKIYQDDRLVAENDDWQNGLTDVATAATASGAFSLAAGSKDAAVVLTLAPGSYTAVVGSTGGAAGTALVEVYEVAGTN